MPSPLLSANPLTCSWYMMASLNQSSSTSLSAAISLNASMATSSRSRDAPEQSRRIVCGIDAQSRAAPGDNDPFAGDQVLDRAHASPVAVGSDLDIAEMEPELARRGIPSAIATATALSRAGD